MTRQKPDKQRGGNAFVAIGKGMILDDEIQQIGCFLFNTGIELLAAKRLVNGFQRAFERIVFLVAEQSAQFLLFTPQPDLLDRFIVGDSALSGLLDSRYL